MKRFASFLVALVFLFTMSLSSFAVAEDYSGQPVQQHSYRHHLKKHHHRHYYKHHRKHRHHKRWHHKRWHKHHKRHYAPYVSKAS